jgi:hypothetical protein
MTVMMNEHAVILCHTVPQNGLGVGDHFLEKHFFFLYPSLSVVSSCAICTLSAF